MNPQTPPPKNPKARTNSIDKTTQKILSDTIIGLNTRKKDNIIQAIIVLCFILLGSLIGLINGLAKEAGEIPLNLFLGSIGGLLAGFFLSGTGLMLFRTIQHLRGKHD